MKNESQKIIENQQRQNYQNAQVERVHKINGINEKVSKYFGLFLGNLYWWMFLFIDKPTRGGRKTACRKARHDPNEPASSSFKSAQSSVNM